MSAVEVASGPVAHVRSFNRFYTARIGVLDEGLLQTPYSLTEARVIFELAQSDAVDSANLRRALDIDAGYLSRILRRFESDGLIARDRSTSDGRQQTIRLTPAGRDIFAVLNSRSADEIATMLSHLSREDQHRLLDAMGVIREVLEGERPDMIHLRDPGPGDLGWVIERHGALYAQEYGWNQTFEALVARIVADYAAAHDPAREHVWIAEANGMRAGCVFCVKKDEETAQLRLLLVEPHARGLGIGARLVNECIQFARNAGYRGMTLWTNDCLHAARHIYERAGFRLTEEEHHHSFGHDLVGQNWWLDL